MKTIFIKHEIKSEADLPKVEDTYFVISKIGGKYLEHFIPEIKDIIFISWSQTYLFWLEEKEIPTDEDEEYRFDLINELMDFHERPENSNKEWKNNIVEVARSKGYGLNQN